MNEALSAIIQTYALGSKDFADKLNQYSKLDLMAIISNLLTLYFNDKNSSTLREYTTLTMAGYQPRKEKLGYNGFRTTSFGKIEYCEVKPKNWNPETKKNLDGSGNYSDYTWERFAKHQEHNPIILSSGFREGKLLYVIGFEFNSQDFTDNLKNKLNKAFPNGARQAGMYLRSANFNYKNFYREANKIFVDKELHIHQDIFNKEFYNWLQKND